MSATLLPTPLTHDTHRLRAVPQRAVPQHIHHNDITRNLSYYGDIQQISDTNITPDRNSRDDIVMFDPSAKLTLLNSIWSVNIKGVNICIAPNTMNNQQLKYRQTHVAGFTGKSADNMQRACQLRLYYDNQYLITGRPRIFHNTDYHFDTDPQQISNAITKQSP